MCSVCLSLELDPLAAAECALKATDEEISQIVSLIGPNLGSPGAPDLDANRDFHRQIYLHSHNPVLVPILDSLWSRCDRYRFLLAESNYPDFAPEDHERIASTLIRREPAGASALLREHLSRSFSEMARMISGILDGEAGPDTQPVSRIRQADDLVTPRSL